MKYWLLPGDPEIPIAGDAPPPGVPTVSKAVWAKAAAAWDEMVEQRTAENPPVVIDGPYLPALARLHAAKNAAAQEPEVADGDV